MTKSTATVIRKLRERNALRGGGAGWPGGRALPGAGGDPGRDRPGPHRGRPSSLAGGLPGIDQAYRLSGSAPRGLPRRRRVRFVTGGRGYTHRRTNAPTLV